MSEELNNMEKGCNKVIVRHCPILESRQERYNNVIRFKIPGRFPTAPESEVSIIVPKDLDISSGLVIGKSVNIEGHVEAFTTYDSAMERRISNMEIYADKIVPDTPLLKKMFGDVPGTFCGPVELCGVFAGEVISAVEPAQTDGKRNYFCRLVVEIPGVGENKHSSRISFDYNTHPAEGLPAFEYKARVTDSRRNIVERGDMVYIIAFYSNRTSQNKDGVFVSHKNWFVKDIRLQDALI